MMTRFPSFIKEDNPEGSGDSKQVAQQQVGTQRQVLAQREIEAKQKVATAKGEAKSILVVEAKEFIQCPLCRRVNKLDLNDPGKKAIRVPDGAD